MFVATGAAQAETRTLKLYFTHTKERAEIPYKRNGRFLPEGLDRVNYMLRDWRRNEKTKMDPRVVDLLWEVYQASGSRDYIHIVSAYRSPATNSMLRSRSSGVAKNSQHTLGKAIDFFLPDVPVSKVRALGLKAQGGGVGFYPKSGSPFVHLDVGSVRHWPRMNRKELMAVFPDGRTIHVPSDGKPLPGYQQALAAYESRQRNPGQVQLAAASAGGSSGRSGGLLANLFGGGNQADEEEDAVAEAPVRREAPAPQREVAPAPTSQAIVAALPDREVPIPTFAPRPQVAVGPAAAPVPAEPVQVAAAAPQALPFEVRAPEAQPEVTAFAAVPVPTWRPQLEAEVAAVKAAVVEDAAPVEVASASPALPEALSIAALVGQRPASSGTDAIQNLLASGSQAPRGLAVQPAVPTVRADENGDMVVLAALPQTDQPSAPLDAADLAASATLKERAIAATRDSRVAPLPADAEQRVAMLPSQSGGTVGSAFDSGIRTTTKNARPQPGQARRQTQPVVVPVAEESATWVFTAGSVSTMTAGTRAPSLAHEIVRKAPDTVYTAGFQQGTAPDPQRFSGRAVQFMSVARFN